MLMSSNWVCSRSFLSSAASGSSSSSSFGRLTSARASATRWRWPPESWCGLRAPKPVIFTISRISPTWRRISSRPLCSCSRPKATFFSTLMCGNSAYDWNIMFTGRS